MATQNSAQSTHATAPEAAQAAPGETSPPPKAANDTEKKHRQMITSIIGIDLSHARTNSHIKRALGDPAVEEQVRDLRAQMKKAKEEGKADEAGIVDLKKQIAALTENQIRVSGDAPIALATILDKAIKEFIIHAIRQAMAADRKQVDVHFLHDGPVKELSCWAFFRDLDCIVNYDPEYEEQLRQKRAAANKANKEARAAAKKAAETGGAAKGGATGAKKVNGPAPAAAAADTEAKDGGADGAAPGTNFFTYIENAIKTIRQDEEFKGIRVSQRLREYCSQVVIEAIVYFTNSARISVQDVNHVRTLSAKHVKAESKRFMTQVQCTEADIRAYLEHAEAKLGLYQAHISAEKARKEQAMDPAKKAEMEQRKREQSNARLMKTAEEAKKKALAQAQRAKDLETQVKALGATAATAATAAAGK